MQEDMMAVNNKYKKEIARANATAKVMLENGSFAQMSIDSCVKADIAVSRTIYERNEKGLYRSGRHAHKTYRG